MAVMDGLKKNKQRVFKVISIAVASLLLLSGLLYLVTREEKEKVDIYSPTEDLPDEYVVLIDYPDDEKDLQAIASLTPLVMKDGKYHTMLILDPEGGLSRQQLYTLTHLKEDRTKILFTGDETSRENIDSQLTSEGLSGIEEERIYPLTTSSCGMFRGFSGAVTVGSYEESLWAAAVACLDNMAMVDGGPTYRSQEEAWNDLAERGIPSDYVIVTNPHDHSLEALHAGTPEYDAYDDPWFCPDLSVLTAVMSGYHDAYVITNATPVGEMEGELDMGLSQNRRAAGYREMLRSVAGMFNEPEYAAIVGSASAIPQFLLPGGSEGEIVNSDIMYGFLDEDLHTMDAALGRLIQFDASLASNQLVKTYDMERFADTVEVGYRDIAGGIHQKDWRRHGASFSGFDITYKRMQATPGRWICLDFEDAGFTYDYVGPSNTGVKVADGVVNSMENDLVEICRGSGYVAYRGHGSDYGSLYGIRVYGPNGEEFALSSEDCQTMDVPPQIAFFVSCLNGKIYGHGPGTDPGNDIQFDRLFTLNYLSSGPAVLVGATEVSFSNIGQDLTTLPEEWLPGVVNPSWSDGDHEWDHNDAWYAFVWDGILNHPSEHGTVGQAVRWSENRYMAYPPNNDPTPFEPTGEVDWYEVTFFACYGDPAFRPAIDTNTQPGYDPWHNGPDDM